MDLKAELEKWIESHEAAMELVETHATTDLMRHRIKAEMAKLMINEIRGILAESERETGT